MGLKQGVRSTEYNKPDPLAHARWVCLLVERECERSPFQKAELEKRGQGEPLLCASSETRAQNAAWGGKERASEHERRFVRECVCVSARRTLCFSSPFFTFFFSVLGARCF